jgi:hypothetical protein
LLRNDTFYHSVFFKGSEDSMPAQKRQWSKPQLIVLGRGKPEENVLGACKIIGLTGPIIDNCLGEPGNCQGQVIS